ncbi:MAG TPA: PQQ-binding-like beta-propeller repeat protein [Roseiarcus sp.]|nr:PQQ-binding-like beta-propeller repeat protein [Roseiarcus sp.]
MAPEFGFGLSPMVQPISRRFAAGLLVLTLLAGVGALAQGAPAPGDWFTMNKDYSAQRYVDLDRINKDNVGGLKEVCEVGLNQPVIFNSGLLMVDRTLYVATNAQTVAIDAATCAVRWRNVLELKRRPVGVGNRGLGYGDGKIFRGTNDGRVMAFDAKTGQILWDVEEADTEKLEMFVSAPIVWQRKVFIGIAFSEAGIAGRLLALDAETGKELWRFNTTLGFNAGGGFWASYSLDPATGEVFAGVSNPFPDFDRDSNPNEIPATTYTDSIISVDTATGRLNWHYQAVPRDEHDWDLATTPTLYRTPSGKDMVAIAGKDGYVHGLDRATHSLAFKVPGTSLVNNDVPLDKTWRYVCPGVQGGAMFNGAAYWPGVGTLFVGMADHCAWFVKDRKFGDLGGAGFKDWAAAAKLKAPKGWITALDGDSGRVLWRYRTDSQVLAGLVPTRSGLLFAGDTRGNLLALDSATGALLKRIDAGGALNNGLISYAVGGEQYVAAAVGGMTENPSPIAGPLRVVVYGLHAPDQPAVVMLDRLPPPARFGITVGEAIYGQACSQCHGLAGAGGSAPPMLRQSQLADPALLKTFLMTVLPPMPHLYPGVLNDDDVEALADYLKTKVFKCGPDAPQSCDAPTHPTSGGTKEWQAIYSVVTSPRCINCHTVSSPKLPEFISDYPRQGDDRHPHYYAVIRGDTFPFETAEKTGFVRPGQGTSYLLCGSCHGTRNDPVTGIPGAEDSAHPGQPFWVMAPAKMTFEKSPGVALSGPELCGHLKDKSMNGNRELADTLHHIATEFLVLWAWDPGKRPNGETRTTPPVSHDDFVLDFGKWMNDGAPCPRD